MTASEFESVRWAGKRIGDMSRAELLAVAHRLFVDHARLATDSAAEERRIGRVHLMKQGRR